MPCDEGTAVAANWMRLLEHLGQDFAWVVLTGSCLISSIISDPLSFLQRASTAFRAISRRCSTVSFFLLPTALFLPPLGCLVFRGVAGAPHKVYESPYLYRRRIRLRGAELLPWGMVVGVRKGSTIRVRFLRSISKDEMERYSSSARILACWRVCIGPSQWPASGRRGRAPG